MEEFDFGDTEEVAVADIDLPEEEPKEKESLDPDDFDSQYMEDDKAIKQTLNRKALVRGEKKKAKPASTCSLSGDDEFKKPLPPSAVPAKPKKDAIFEDEEEDDATSSDSFPAEKNGASEASDEDFFGGAEEEKPEPKKKPAPAEKKPAPAEKKPKKKPAPAEKKPKKKPAPTEKPDEEMEGDDFLQQLEKDRKEKKDLKRKREADGDDASAPAKKQKTMGKLSEVFCRDVKKSAMDLYTQMQDLEDMEAVARCRMADSPLWVHPIPEDSKELNKEYKRFQKFNRRLEQFTLTTHGMGRQLFTRHAKLEGYSDPAQIEEDYRQSDAAKVYTYTLYTSFPSAFRKRTKN